MTRKYEKYNISIYNIYTSTHIYAHTCTCTHIISYTHVRGRGKLQTFAKYENMKMFLSFQV